MSEPVNELIGVGLYSLGEAARLTGLRRQNVGRWLRGYDFRHAGEIRHMPPVWPGQLRAGQTQVGLGFLDLMEVRFVHEFRKHGVAWTTIRMAAERAREWFKVDHPFCTLQFKTDGKKIFADVLEQTGHWQMVDLAQRQYQLRTIVAPSLFLGLEFSGELQIARWYPSAQRKAVVLDPDRSFGRPIVVEGGVPTETLWLAVRAGTTAPNVARWYEVPLRAVEAAVEFEEGLTLH